MFGRSLVETMQVEARLGGQFVPILLHRCVSFLREHGRAIPDSLSLCVPVTVYTVEPLVTEPLLQRKPP